MALFLPKAIRRGRPLRAYARSVESGVLPMPSTGIPQRVESGQTTGLSKPVGQAKTWRACSVQPLALVQDAVTGP